MAIRINGKKELTVYEEIEHGSYRLTYPDRTEVHSLTDLPLVTFNQIRNPKWIEDIDIELDIPSEITYIPVSSNLYFGIDKEGLFDIFDIIHEKVGDSVSVHGEITSPFDYFLDLLGYQEGLIALIMEPEISKLILDKYADGIMELAIKMCDKPIDAIKISSPFAGMGFISTEQYIEFVLPYERKIIEAIRAKGVHAYIHTCGSINDRLELMRESKTSGLECLDPVPVGNVDLEDAFKRIGNELFIKGNIDSVTTLLNGDDQKAEADIRQILETGMTKGKGFILSTACSIAPKVTTERLLLLSELVEKYGKY